jgi:hypothetical protein
MYYNKIKKLNKKEKRDFMKYSYGTILKFTPKAIKKHPNDCTSIDRMIVVGKDECIWYQNEDTINGYAHPPLAIPANTILMYDLYRKFDSFVEKANEEIPSLSYTEQCYSGGIVPEVLINKYKTDFKIEVNK